MSRKSPATGTGPAAASLRAQDPHLARERAKYSDPLPSREFLLSLIEQAGVPVEAGELEQRLEILPEEHEAFTRRLAAMERDGQLMRNRRNALCLPSKLDLLKARVEGHPDGFGFAVPEDGSADLFLGPKEMQKTLHGDTVLVRIGPTDRRGRREAYIAEVLVRANTRLVARLHSEHGVLFAVAENRRISQDILVAPGQDGGAQAGQVVMVELLTQPSRHAEPIAKVVEIVGNYADSGMEVEIALRKHALPHAFPPAALAHAARLPNKVTRKDLAGRVDLRHLPLVTIDGETARDFDDAVYCAPEGKGFRLMVAIADVSHYVRPGDALDQEAYLRGNSVYFPRRVIPMLPEELSNGLCSLNPQVDRLCMVCEMTVSAGGEIDRYRFYPAVMHSQARLTYNEVAAILARPAAASAERQALVPHLRMLEKVYRAFFEARSARGAIDFATVETTMEFDDQGKIARVVPVERNDAHRLIEECMLAANVCASDFLAAHKHPTLYRIHPGPTPEKLDAVRQFLGEVGLHLGGGAEPRARDYADLIAKIQDRPDRDLLQTVLLRSLQQARYSPENVGHFGLAYDAYAHFTSPIRRYPDLLVHRAIRAVLAGEVYAPGSWAEIGAHCSATERRADEATRDVEQWLKCWFMRDRINEEFSGTVSSVVHFGLFVTLDEVHVEGLIHISELGQDYYHHDLARHQLLGERSGKRWRLGDRIRIRVVRVDLETTRIDFVPADPAFPAQGAVATVSPAGARKRPGGKTPSVATAPLPDELPIPTNPAAAPLSSQHRGLRASRARPRRVRWLRNRVQGPATRPSRPRRSRPPSSPPTPSRAAAASRAPPLRRPTPSRTVFRVCSRCRWHRRSTQPARRRASRAHPAARSQRSAMAKLDTLIGFHAVASRVRHHAATVVELYVDRTRQDARLRDLLALANERGVRVHAVEAERLAGLAGAGRHQGVVARAEPLPQLHDPVDLVDQIGPDLLLLVLDGVQDPHNLGACLRVADAMGVHAVVAPRDRAVAMTATVQKVASGAADTVPYITVTNLARCLRELQDAGVRVIGTDDQGSTALNTVDVAGPLAMVLGAEGAGLRRLTRETCDALVSIPMLGSVDSLNVSVAAGICLYEVRRRRPAAA